MCLFTVLSGCAMLFSGGNYCERRGRISTFSQRLGFQLVWLACSKWLRLSAGRIAHELPPSGPEAAVHQAAIIRVPLDVASSVSSTFEGLRQQDSHHHYYPPETMHVTICKLGQLPSDDTCVAGRLAELRHIVASYPSFDLTVWGFNLSPTTVFAQVFPHDHTFHSIRRHLGGFADRSIDQPSSERIIDGVARNLAHANVVRFSDLVTMGFIKEVSRFRRTYFGRWTVREVELVRSDKLLSREGLHVIERIPLATN
jgi:2'-5' RNA ligase